MLPEQSEASFQMKKKIVTGKESKVRALATLWIRKECGKKKEETENCQPIRERQVVTVHTAGQKWFERKTNS